MRHGIPTPNGASASVILRTTPALPVAFLKDPLTLAEAMTIVTARYPSLEARNTVLASGMARGAAISYDRLEDLVAELQRS
jgi:hypothetical protein